MSSDETPSESTPDLEAESPDNLSENSLAAHESPLVDQVGVENSRIDTKQDVAEKSKSLNVWIVLGAASIGFFITFILLLIFHQELGCWYHNQADDVRSNTLNGLVVALLVAFIPVIVTAFLAVIDDDRSKKNAGRAIIILGAFSFSALVPLFIFFVVNLNATGRWYDESDCITPPTPTETPTPTVTPTPTETSTPTVTPTPTATPICDLSGVKLNSGTPVPGAAEFVEPSDDCIYVDSDDADKLSLQGKADPKPVDARAWLVVVDDKLLIAHPQRSLTAADEGEVTTLSLPLKGKKPGDCFEVVLLLADKTGDEFLRDRGSGFNVDDMTGNITEMDRFGVVVEWCN